LPAPALVGSLTCPDGSSWLFLQDLGDRHLVATTLVDAMALAEMLGHLHSIARAAGASQVPARSLGELAASMMSSAACLRDACTADREQRSLRRELATDLELLAGAWGWLEDSMRGVPDVLTHGDVATKHVRRTPAGQIALIDWAEAAWSSPAVDAHYLAYLPERATGRYVETLERGSFRTNVEIGRLVLVGRTIRVLDGISWACMRLSSGRSARAARQLNWYRDELRSCIDGLEVAA
jgi:hypothetical protein